MNNYTELISKYINGDLSATEKTAFETELNSNAELKKEYKLQVNITKGAERMGLKNQLNASFKKVRTKKRLQKSVIGLAIALAVAGAILIVKNTAQQSHSENKVMYELNEEGKNTWAEADKQLESQLFQLNPERDTIIETQQGIVIAIPAHAFKQANGTVPTKTIDLEIKEAMTAAQIMNAGLSTMSNDQLLETGGMFYINAREGDDNLVIDQSKPLNVNVPVNTNKNDMMLFKGERMADGSINWTDPTPMKRKLSTVDITKLDFYPEHFLDTLKALGYNTKNKKLTDSMYYSFSGYCDLVSTESPVTIATSDTAKASSCITIVNSAKLTAASYRSTSSGNKPFDGQNLFKGNCSMCHSLGNDKLTGPGLKNVMQRVPNRTWIKKWIMNSDKMVHNGDAYAKKIKRENGNAAMTVFEGTLSGQELDALIDFLSQNTAKENCEIDPSRIKAIWNNKFNRTILATKEFEERLKVIFTTCDSRIFNLYVHNLDKNLYEIDSMAANLLSGDQRKKFLEFYARKDGGVDISDTQNKQLQAYFEVKRTAYTKAITATLQKMYHSEREKSQIAFTEFMKQQNNENIRYASNFAQELDINLTEAYGQLGFKRRRTNGNLTATTHTYVSSPFVYANYVSAPVLQTGWSNVDRYTYEATASRTGLNYTDPKSGKKVNIAYKPVSVTIANYKDYDRVLCYMIPDKLSSFQTMKNTGTKFHETFNELMGYAIVTIGFKGDQRYYHAIKKALPQNYTVSLTSIKPEALDQLLNTSFPLNQPTDLAKEIDYQAFDMKETLRQNKIAKREAVRYHLLPMVLPCASAPVGEDNFPAN
jgi:cytochrome c2